MNKKYIELQKEMYALRELLAKIDGKAEFLYELNSELERLEKHGSNNMTEELKTWANKKERDFWYQSTPLARDLCNKVIEMGKTYIESEERPIFPQDRILSEGDQPEDKGEK